MRIIKFHNPFLDLDGKFYPVLTDVANPTSTSILENGTLIINGIKKEDEGVYQCTVSNDVGTPLHKSATLRVIGENKNLINSISIYITCSKFKG